MKIVLWINNEKDISLGLYIVLHYPLGGERGKLIKGFKNREGNQGGRKRKKGKFWKKKLLAVPNHKN